MLALNRLLIDIRPHRIIEIGTGAGGLTFFLGTYARIHGVRFVTIDIRAMPVEMAGPAWAVGVNQTVGDVWDAESPISELIRQEGPSLVLCDGGDKPREFRTFTKWLKPGDVICAHDYPTMNWDCVEIEPADVNLLGLEKYHADDMQAGAWACRRKA